MGNIAFKKILTKKITLIILAFIFVGCVVIFSLLNLSKSGGTLVIVSPELVQTKSENNLFNAKVENKTEKEFKNIEVNVSLLDNDNNVFDKVSINKDILAENEVWNFSIPVSKKAVDFKAEVTTD